MNRKVGVILVLNTNAYLHIHPADEDTTLQLLLSVGSRHCYLPDDDKWIAYYWEGFDWDNTKHSLYPAFEQLFYKLAELPQLDEAKYRWVFTRNNGEPPMVLDNYRGNPYTEKQCSDLKFTNNSYHRDIVSWNVIMDRKLKGVKGWQLTPC